MTYLTILLRTGLAVLLGGIIGLERQSKHRPAGFRTYILVCLSSALVMMLSELMFEKYNTLYGISPDPARMAAQVISGIGFLGAGTIIHYGPNVKGLTSAASLWAVAAIGLAVGSGFYALAITVSVVLYATLFLFNAISLKMNKQGNSLEILITLHNKPKTLGAINILLAKNNAKILDMVFINSAKERDDGSKDDEIINVRIVAMLEDGASNVELLNGIRAISGVIDVERM